MSTDQLFKLLGKDIREGQLLMANSIEAKLNAEEKEKIVSIIQAPTGTGKSLGYLLPVFQYCKRNPDKKVLIISATNSLLDQLEEKEIPIVKVLFPEIRHSVQKGFNNYACRKKIKNKKINETLFTIGERKELPEISDEEWRKKYTIKLTDCKKKACKYYDTTCYWRTKRKEMEDVQVIVTNYHFLFSMAKINSDILSKFNVIVCDEAHELEKIARSIFKVTLSKYDFKKLEEFCTSFLKNDVHEINEEFSSICELLSYSTKSSGRCEVDPDLSDIYKSLEALEKRVEHSIEKNPSLWITEDDKNDSSDPEIQKRNKINQAKNLFTELKIKVDSFQRYDSEYEVLTLDKNNDSYYLAIELIEVDTTLGVGVWNKINKLFFCSATITPHKFFVKQTGIRTLEGYKGTYLDIESPFDIKNQAEIQILDLDPTSISFDDNVAEVIRESIKKIPGKILCLFTSKKSLEMARWYLDGFTDRTILAQDGENKQKISEEFAKSKDAILLGLDSFWTGVDFPGMDAIIINKLPFPRPDDPAFEVLKERDGKSFFDNYVIPLTINKLRQACGRLIRRYDDKGIIVVCDQRLRPNNKKYSIKLFNALDDYSLTY